MPYHHVLIRTRIALSSLPADPVGLMKVATYISTIYFCFLRGNADAGAMAMQLNAVPTVTDDFHLNDGHREMCFVGDVIVLAPYRLMDFS